MPLGPTLLVIEDLEDQAVLVGITARHAHPGLDVQTASNGLEGIAYLAGEGEFADRGRYPLPDLIILDLYMPEMDGFEVLEWLRGNPHVTAAPVVVLTGSLLDEDEARARDSGAVEVHRKPESLSELGPVVKDIVLRHIGRSRILSAHMWEAG